MLERLDLGSTPAGESCEQLGRNYRPDVARAECQAYLAQLRRLHGEPPPGAALKIAPHSHDFGTYLSVEVRFSDTDEAAAVYAYKVEDNTPEFWDDKAMMNLARELDRLGVAHGYYERLSGPVDPATA